LDSFEQILSISIPSHILDDLGRIDVCGWSGMVNVGFRGLEVVDSPLFDPCGDIFGVRRVPL